MQTLWRKLWHLRLKEKMASRTARRYPMRKSTRPTGLARLPLARQ
jgi:hypothetical protein